MEPLLRPLGDRVLIKPEVNPEQTDSGLWLSEHRKPEQAGTVVAVGTPVHPQRDALEEVIEKLVIDPPEVAFLRSLVARAPLVQVGDYVLFGWNVGQEVLIDAERYLLMRESDILAVVEEEGVSA